MNELEKCDDALAAEYALGTLRGPARLRFRRRLANEPALLIRVAYWQEMLCALDGHLSPVTPPETVWKKIMLDLPTKNVQRKSHPYLGWMVAAGLAVVTVLTWVIPHTPELAPLLVLNDAQQQGQWVVSADSRRQALSITPLHPIDIAAKKSLQLWLIPAGEIPISLGLLDTREPTLISLKNRTLENDAVIAISLEPQGGSPTGQPTGSVLSSGKI